MKFKRTKYKVIFCLFLLSVMLGCGGGGDDGDGLSSQICSGPGCKEDTAKLLIGTETLSFLKDNDEEFQESIDVINNELGIKNVKLRLDHFKMVKENGEFEPFFCPLNLNTNRMDCTIAKYSLDKIVDMFIENSWAMYPMFSQQNQFENNRREFTDEIIDEYVEFVDWFIDRYHDKVNIIYIELGNNPANNWRVGSLQDTSYSENKSEYDKIKDDLVKQQNNVYDRIKSKYPDIIITSPGFEFHSDEEGIDDDWAYHLLSYFLDSSSGAKYDALAIHGYSPGRQTACAGQLCFYPPTRTAQNNIYTGVPGLAELRKKLDESGWHDRKIFMTEQWLNLPMSSGGIIYTREQDNLVAALNVQDFLLKMTMRYNGHPVLSGINKMLICRRDSVSLYKQCSLMPDGKVTEHIKAMGLLVSKLEDYPYDSHISGEFDNENQIWIEKFVSGDKELYIYFKPFEYNSDKQLEFDNKIIQHELDLTREPALVTVTDIFGNSQTFFPGSKITVQAENTPKYLEVE